MPESLFIVKAITSGGRELVIVSLLKDENDGVFEYAGRTMPRDDARELAFAILRELDGA